MARFGVTFCGFVTYVLNNGAEFVGYCDESNWTLSGFKEICQSLWLDNFNLFDMLVLTYDVGEIIDVSLVDGRIVEIVLDNNVIASSKLEQSVVVLCKCVI